VTHVSSAWGDLLVKFSPMMTAPTFENFVALVLGWVLCLGRRTITRVALAGAPWTGDKDFSVFPRFLSRAVWAVEKLTPALVALVLPWLPPVVVVLVDDTLCRKGGPHLWGAGMHHDPLRSTYGRGRVVSFAFGHNWVVVSLWVPLPWNPARGIAIPVAFRLYRQKKRCPPGEYRKRTDLAREALEQVQACLPERRLHLVGDREYACHSLVQRLPNRVGFTGPMPMNAALYDKPKPSRGRGRPRVKGARLPTPAQMAADPRIPWQPVSPVLYGRQVPLLIKTCIALWYSAAGGRPGRVVVTRDPSGRIEDRAYFGTGSTLNEKTPLVEIEPPDASETLTGFSRRWAAEEMHRNTKQHLGLEDPQNGWWRRPSQTPAPRKTPGPQPHATRGANAVNRTVPLIFVTYALVVLRYLAAGDPVADVAKVRLRCPWRRLKREPSFGDMLASARRDLWASAIFAETRPDGASPKNPADVLEWLLAAA